MTLSVEIHFKVIHTFSTCSVTHGYVLISSFLVACGHKLDWSHQYIGHSWAEVSSFKLALCAYLGNIFCLCKKENESFKRNPGYAGSTQKYALC